MKSTYNPIIKEEQVNSRSLNEQRQTLGAKKALVLLSTRREPMIISHMSSESPSFMDIFSKVYNMMYTIDITEHTLNYQCVLPGKKVGLYFNAEIQLRCSVVAPEDVVKRNVTDVGEVIKLTLDAFLSRYSRRFDLEDYERMEEALNQAFLRQLNPNLAQHNDSTGFPFLRDEFAEMGIAVSKIHISLKLDKKMEETLVARRSELEKIQHDIVKNDQQNKLIDQSTSFQRTKAITDAEHQKELDTRIHEVKLQQNSNEDVLMKQKLSFYNDLIKMGRWGVLALQIAQKPDDFGMVMQHLDEYEQGVLKNEVDMLSMVLQTGAVEDHHINETARRVLDRFSQRVVGMTTHTSPPLYVDREANTQVVEVQPRPPHALNEGSDENTSEAVYEEVNENAQPVEDNSTSKRENFKFPSSIENASDEED